MALFERLSQTVMWVGVALASVVAGAVLAGTADVLAPDLIAGTLLGPTSEATHIVWTLIGATVLIGGREVFAR